MISVQIINCQNHIFLPPASEDEEGNIFSLCVSLHLDGGTPFPGQAGGTPSQVGVPPSKVREGEILSQVREGAYSLL